LHVVIRVRTTLPTTLNWPSDVAKWPNPTYGHELMRLENWTSPAERAATAIANALQPESARAHSALPCRVVGFGMGYASNPPVPRTPTSST
jgi:hypothetical protein